MLLSSKDVTTGEYLLNSRNAAGEPDGDVRKIWQPVHQCSFNVKRWGLRISCNVRYGVVCPHNGPTTAADCHAIMAAINVKTERYSVGKSKIFYGPSVRTSLKNRCDLNMEETLERGAWYAYCNRSIDPDGPVTCNQIPDRTARCGPV